MIFKLAWRNIWRNKRRSLITIASIFFAVFLAIAMRSLQLGTYDKMIDNIVRFFSGYIQVHKKGYWEEQNLDYTFQENDTLLSSLEKTPGVKGVAPRLQSFALCSFGNQTKGAAVIGLEPEKETELINLNDKISAGKPFTSGDTAIVIGEGLAHYLGIKAGDTLVLLGQGMYGMTAAGKYAVSGIATLSAPQLNDNMIFMPLKQAQAFFGAKGYISAYALLLPRNTLTEESYQSILSKLDTGRYEVMTWKHMMPELLQTIQADNAGGIIMLVILYMIIVFGIFGTVLMMTTERSHEFGVLIAIGMKKGKLALTLLVETLLLGLIGVIAGAMAAAPLVYHFHKHPIPLTGQAGEALKKYGFEAIIPTSTDPAIFLTQALVVLIAAMIISIYPLIFIKRLKPVEAMKS